MFRRIVGPLIVLSLVGFTGCSNKFTLPSSTAVTLELSVPANTTLLPGQTAQFSASVSNAPNTSVIWEVNSVVGGNSQVGTISTSGLYTAPSTFPASAIRGSSNAVSSTTVTITAAAQANTSATANATVTLMAPPSVTVSPSSASLFVGATQQFTATVTNSSNTAVSWQVNGVAGGNATVGTITAAGLYTAPGSVPNPSSVTVTAVSAADANAKGSATVTIQGLPPVVTVSPSTASVPGNTTQQFTATVTNTSNTAVTWEVNSIPGGNSTIGTITTTGLYTAPAAIPNPATVTVSAVSLVNANSVGSAAVTITTPEVVVVSPSSATVQLDATQQFTGTSSIPNDTLTWQVNGVTGGDSTYGTITTGGLYTAPSATPANSLVIVKAISGINPSIFGSATVSIGTTAPSVSVTPGSAGVVINTTQQFTATVSPSNLSQVVQWEVDGIPGGNTTVGTISAAGLYLAPLLVPNPTTVTIGAASNAAQNLFGTATVTVTLPTTPISVTVNPATASVMVGQSQQFSATVSPNNNPAVTWAVSSVQFGCVASTSNACGSVDSSGNYTAPTSVPGGGQSADVTVTATSVADPTKSGTATVTVTPAPTPTLSITATSTVVCSTLSVAACSPAQSPTLTAVGNNFPNNAQLQFNWTLGCVNADEDSDTCADATDGDNGTADDDGPGQIMASGGGTAGTTVQNSTAIVYLPPEAVYTSVTTSNGCPSPGTTANSNFAYVPVTVSTTYNNVTYTSPATCIQIVYQFQ